MNRMALVSVAAFVTLLAVFVAAVFVIDASDDDRIADGVRIGRVDVGGLSTGAARTRVRRELARDPAKALVVRYHARWLKLTGDESRARIDVDASVEAARRKGRDASNAFARVFGGGDVNATVTPRITYSRPAVEAFVTRVAKHFDAPAKNADIDVRDGKLSRTRARAGIAVQRPALLAAVQKRLATQAGTRSLALPVKVTKRPDRNLDDLAKRYPTVIAVDRDAKQLRLYKNLKLVHRYRIAVGKAGLETAAGRYKILDKQVDPVWHVPLSDWAGDLAGKTIPAGDPRNPLEARWMAFHDGQGIHGTAELDSLGTAASHGCIRMAVTDVKQLYKQVKVGTPVFMQ
jgi:lipoprotein-anchoring transpeptidase ErfK/SrfK